MSILPLSFSFLFLIFLHLPSVCLADIGTAAWYPPPYSRELLFPDAATACYGSDASQFPSSYLFGAAGEGIWDNGAACGRQYKLRCLSAVAAGSCQPDQTIQVKIVDYARSLVSPGSASGTTIVLSQKAFATVANWTASQSINIEIQQV
ncbi:unnamed protein product [Linum tenue]|uniref:Expansin-like EG45 domain-containing protein n=1 Tax=Linum tenue TaxID=586396 RepID=A0AAV0HWJ8_9ROSI|nr:unnamed protein product [Linum tenue]